MRKTWTLPILLTTWLLCAGCTEENSTHNSTETHTHEAGIFAEGIISTGNELALTFSPDGQTVYFTKREILDDSTRRVDIYASALRDGAWSTPERTSFSSAYRDADQFIAPDGSKLYFMSERPLPGTIEKHDYDLWAVEKDGTGWGEAQHLGSVVNSSPGWEGFPTVTHNGTLYFFSEREGGYGESDIYRSRVVEGVYAEPENLGPTLNTAHWDGLPYIAPDERFLLFYSEKPGGYGEGDLYVSYNHDGVWTEPDNLGPSVNTDASELFPHISPDGKYLFFTRYVEAGLRHIYYIAVEHTPLQLSEATARVPPSP